MTRGHLFPELYELLQRLPVSDATRIPIVLVPGFMGWGSPLLNSFNYFGGFHDIAQKLVQRGWTVIVPQLGPFSSNWERACELYAQLTWGSYDPDVWDVVVDYGVEFQRVLPQGQSAVTENRRQAFSLTPGADHQRLTEWKWGADKPVHFIGHSQGGNTVRYLIHLLRNGGNPPYFSEPRKEGWVQSLVTLCTPHNGTTIIDILDPIDPTGLGHLLIRQSISTAAFAPPAQRVYDPALDHWGIAPLENEPFLDMVARLSASGGPLQLWFENKHNGFYDNSIAGVAALNNLIGAPSDNVYYFTLSFCATIPTSAGSLLRRILRFLTPRPPASGLPLTAAAGSQVPRIDMFPLLQVFAYAMGAYSLTRAQSRILGVSSTAMHQNDGVVNTASMRGPLGSVIVDVTAGVKVAKGRFLSLGVNEGMDHVDAIGIVVDTDLIAGVETMFADIAELLWRLP